MALDKTKYRKYFAGHGLSEREIEERIDQALQFVEAAVNHFLERKNDGVKT